VEVVEAEEAGPAGPTSYNPDGAVSRVATIILQKVAAL
jgi:hypothetical protein